MLLLQAEEEHRRAKTYGDRIAWNTSNSLVDELIKAPGLVEIKRAYVRQEAERAALVTTMPALGVVEEAREDEYVALLSQVQQTVSDLVLFTPHVKLIDLYCCGIKSVHRVPLCYQPSGGPIASAAGAGAASSSTETPDQLRMFVTSMTSGQDLYAKVLKCLPEELHDWTGAVVAAHDQGIVIHDVIAQTPADLAGLQAGDILSHIGSDAVGSPEDFYRLIYLRHTDENVKFHVKRKDLPLILSLAVGDPLDATRTFWAPLYIGGDFWGVARIVVAGSEVDYTGSLASAVHSSVIVLLAGGAAVAVLAFLLATLALQHTAKQLMEPMRQEHQSLIGEVKRVAGHMRRYAARALAVVDAKPSTDTDIASLSQEPHEEIRDVVTAFRGLAVAYECGQTQQNEHLDLVASIFRHELNNILHPAGSDLELWTTWKAGLTEADMQRLDELNMPLGRLEPIQAAIQKAHEAVEHISGIVKDIMLLTPIARPELSDLSRMVEDTVEEFTGDARIAFTENIVPGVMVMCHQDQLVFMFRNLIKNAVEAIHAFACHEGRHAGRIRVRVFAEDSSPVFEIRDNGTGIAANILAGLGKFGVHGRKGGTGTGMFLVYKIAAMNGARVEVESDCSPHGHGTLVRVRFAALAEGSA
jgi:signal transduction histidine kinase